MNLRRKIAVTISALAMTIGGGFLTAPPAAADEPCASGKLCLYRSTLFRTMEFSTGNVDNCWYLDYYDLGGVPWSGIMSYRNNLGVTASLWEQSSGYPFRVATINVGGSSSNTSGGDPAFEDSEWICTGSAVPPM